MKKYLKIQAKKSLSLLMAVLMLLSCWVWVVPTEAEAANAEEGEYKVRLAAWSDDDGQVSSLTANVYYDGGSKAMTAADLTNAGTSTGTKALNNYNITAATCDTLPGFPTKFDVKINIDGCNGHKNGTYFFQLQVWDNDDSKWVIVNNDAGMGIGWSDFKGEKSIGSDDGRTHTMDSVKPEASTIKLSSGTQETKTLSIPAITATNEVSVTCTTPGVYDQYGVKIKTPTAYKVTDSTGNTVYNKDDHGIWCDGATVKANANVQKNITAGTSVYLTSEYDSIKATTAKINLTYPTYTVTVNPNGGTMAMSNNTPQSTTWSVSKAYGVSADAWPTGGRDANNNFIGATKTGNTFKGFWSEPQPTSGAADYNSYEANFANPVDTTTFTNHVNNGGVQDGKYVTVTNEDGSESVYYNAGKEWNAATDKQVTGNATYYAWWISQDITVKFYDIDGKFLGTKTTKYGKTEAENFYPNPKDVYNAGAYEYKTFAKQWRDITGVVITEGSYEFGPIATLTLTPVYTTKEYKDEYNVTFINPVNGNSSTTVYNYRDIVTAPTFGMPNALKNDAGYTYEFEGWTVQKPAKGNYHTVAQGDSSVAINTDWVVREDLTYYAVYRSTVKQYLIAFSYTDSTGSSKTDVTTISYGSPITTPANVNRTYASGGYGYNLEGWDYVNNDSVTVMLDVDGVVTFNTTNVFLTAENLAGATPEAPIVFTANYDDGEPMPYTVTFKYKDDKGADKTVTAEVYHGTTITQDTVDKLVVPAQYDDGAALYTFSGNWQVTEGAADKSAYATDEFTSFSPTSHITFEAIYDDGVPFYTVTYIDGPKTYSERVLSGSNLPTWLVDSGEDDENGEDILEEYVPADREAETGTYKFAGWFDETQKDAEEKVTNGTKYTSASEVTSDLTLYSQYQFEAKKFIIKFLDYTGKVELATTEVEAGQSYADAFYRANKAAQYREADNTYTYEFIGWDQVYNEDYLVCEGKDMTFTAKYKANYKYYKANWYKDSSMSGDPLATTNYIYEGKIYAPSVDLEIPDGKAFNGWFYLKDGVETAYHRGMTITADMSFYATYKDAPVVYLVTTVVNGVEETYRVAAGDKAEQIADPDAGYVDPDKHNKFDGWYTDLSDSNSKVELTTTAINQSIKVYAKFVEIEHDKSLKELVEAPTYYKEGSEKVWCACNKDKTTENVAIPKLTDTKAPTGTIYLGTTGKWSSTDTVGAAATDGNEVSLYANADTDIILTVNDTGDVNNAYNPSGEGKGIKIIRGFISTGVFGAGSTEAEIAGIQTIFEDSSENLNNTANYVSKLGTYGLTDGETYIAYYYVADKAGNVLNTNVRTAKFIYDTTAPTITFDGEGDAENNIYCGKVTLTGIEVGATVELDGEAKALTTTSAAGIGSFVITEAGTHTVTIIDKAGNKASKRVTVKEGHSEVVTEKAADCYNAGYNKVVCAICEKVIKEETTAQLTHNYVVEKTVVADCFKAGYTLEKCTLCGDERKINETDQLEHEYATDADNNIIYTVTKAATCKTKGEKVAKCILCGKGELTEEIDIDTANGHVYGPVKVLKPTCTEKGKYYQVCKYCYELKDGETIAELDHVDTGRYDYIKEDATCYSEGEKEIRCRACDEALETVKIDKIDHILKYVIHNKDTDKSEDYPLGYAQYECQAVGCTYTEGKTAITAAEKPKYTVTFKGAGEDDADLTFTKTEGESISAEDVYGEKDENGNYIVPTKASTNTEKYTFAGWKGTDNKVVKLPLKVTKNETYTADFTASTRIYTHQFRVETEYDNKDDTVEFATLLGKYNDTDKKPASIPTLKADDDNSYKFMYWTDSAGVKVENFDVKGDATFFAKFEAVPYEYKVTFYNEDNNYLWQDEVIGNETVTYGKVDTDGNIVVPTKNHDKDYHYAFAGWKYNGTNYDAIDAEFGPFTANTRIYAYYNAIEHNFDTVVEDPTKTYAATCTKQGMETKKCSCGEEFATILPIIDHDYEELEDGSKKCKVCGDTVEAEAKEVTIYFKDKATDNTIKSVKVTEGKTYKFTAPAKASTAQYDYTFSGWTNEAGDAVCDTAEIEVTAGTTDAVYYANYTSATRTYNITYVNFDYEHIETFTVAYGAAIPACTKADPTRAYDSDYHYIFSGWSVAADATVTGALTIVAQYDEVKHNHTIEKPEDASCLAPATTYLQCDGCEHKLAKGTFGSILPHTPDANGEQITVQPGLGIDGEKTFTCVYCEEKQTVKIPGIPADKITIIIYNNSGKLSVNGLATATLYEVVNKGTADEALVKYEYEGIPNPADTNASGEVYFTVPKGKTWKAEITGENIEGGYGGEVKAGTNTFGKAAVEEEKPEANGCTCSCHKNTFWGMIFRFFQKLIMWMTGSPKCCADPDTKIW